MSAGRGPLKVRKLPVVVEAMLLEARTDTPNPDLELDPNTESVAAIAGWMAGNGFSGFHVSGVTPPYGLTIETLEGPIYASPGDYIIRGAHGEFYPCKPDVFADTYEEVTDE